MSHRSMMTPPVLAALAALLALIITVKVYAQAPTYPLDIPSTDVASALRAFARQAHQQVVFDGLVVRGKTSALLKGTYTAEDAIRALLSGTGLSVRTGSKGEFQVSTLPSDPREGDTTSAASSADANEKEAGKKSSQDFRVAHLGQAPAGSQVGEKNEEKKKEALEEIVVTGTHIRGVESVGSPTLTISRADIDHSGYQTTQQLVGSLPQNFNSITMAAPYGVGGTSLLANQNSENATGVDLRGLGAQSTLTLIDGQRAAGSVLGRVVDVSLIPLSMVDHVDIVTGGASAIYGADAVGGVANFVLRHAYNGADTQAYYGGTANGGDRLQLSQTFGRDWGTSGFIVGYEFGRDDHFDVVGAGLAPPIPGGLEPNAEWVAPDAKTNSLYLSGYLDLSDAVQIFTDGSYVHKSQQLFSAFGYPAFSLSVTQPSSETSEEYGGSAGARIKIGDAWQVKMTGSFSAHENGQNSEVTQIVSGSSSSFPQGTTSRSSLTSGSLIADGTLFSVGGTHVKSAFGVEARRETLSETITPAGPFQDMIPLASRSVWSAFGELNVPFVAQGGWRGLRELTLSLSARDDHYSDFGNAFEPQAGLVWKPAESLTLRGSVARAFRAPDLYALNQFAATGINPLPLSTPAAPTPITTPVLSAGGGNPNLGPERANTWTAGFDYQLPIRPHVRISASYFDIDYKERINTPLGTSNVINSVAYPANILVLHPTPQQAAAFYGLGVYEGNSSSYPWDGNLQTLLQQIPNLILLDNRNLNVATERYRGLDLQADARFDTAAGEVSAGLNATKTLTHFQQITPQTSAVTIFNYVGEPAGFRARANVGLSHGPYSGFLFMNYTGGYANDFTVPQSRMASWTTFDLTLKWDSSAVVHGGLLDNVAITASAQNLFNRDPPPFLQNTISGFLFDPVNANPLRRFLGMNVVKKW